MVWRPRRRKKSQALATLLGDVGFLKSIGTSGQALERFFFVR
jgi:hypothetical protein